MTSPLDQARALMRGVRTIASPHCTTCGRSATRVATRRDTMSARYACDEHDAPDLVALGFRFKDLPGAATLRAADRFVATGELPEVTCASARPSDSSALAERLETRFAESDPEDC